MSKHVARVGCGLVGSAWALVFARAGWRVRLYDEEAAQLTAAETRIAANARELVRHELLDDAPSVLARIASCSGLQEAVEGVSYVQERLDNTGGRVSGTAPGSRVAAAGDVRRRPGEVFRDCAECPEMVVLPGGGLALGRYEVTVGEYRAFASATGGGAGGGCFTFSDGDSWRNLGFPQTDRHPVTCVSWDDAQLYVSWLSRTTGARYRLPTEAEWERAAAGSQRGCDLARTGNRGTCPVGSYGSNAAGLSDMVGNLWEWTEDCWEGDCSSRVLRGGSWSDLAVLVRPGARLIPRAGSRFGDLGFRVSRTLD